MLKRLVLFCLLSLSCYAQKDGWLSIGGGVCGVIRPKDRTGMIQVEYQPSPLYQPTSWFNIKPQVGFFENFRGSFYGYGGFRFEFKPTSWLLLTPGFAPGLYVRAHGKKLGFPIEFKSSFEIAFEYKKNKRRFSAQFYHISNASIDYHNPGTEMIVFSYVFRL